jgi:hypothetical protein
LNLFGALCKKPLNDADQQWVGWKNDMQPLLDEENALD